MNIFRSKETTMQEFARLDAAAGINSVEDHLLGILGPRPSWDPVGNQWHHRLQERMSPSILSELREDLRRAEEELSHHSSPTAVAVVIVLLFFTEAIACVLLMRTLGLENPERAVLGIALAAFLFFMTYLLTRGRGGSDDKK